MLQSVLELAGGLLSWACGLVALVATFCWEILYHLHVEAPRLEGLLVGVLLAWLLLRREKHPLLRVLSAPLKLVLDILDLAWDQLSEMVSDLWNTARDWILGGASWCRDRLRGGYDRVMDSLGKLKERLGRK